MTFSKIGRIMTALVASAALGLGMTACGGGTIGYLYVTGQFYNQLSAFKIDDYTGNLTPIDHQPFTSGGTTPITVLVRPGGRYVYVINQGTPPNPALLNLTDPSTNRPYAPPVDSGISVFSVGGDGVLTYQTTYTSNGFMPIWATFDSTGNYLYVVDKYSEYYNIANPATPTAPVSQNASITLFTSDASTGRLFAQTNNAVLSSVGHIPIGVFEVGQNPVMTQASGSCLYTMNPTSIFPYVMGAGGQLTVATTGVYTVSGATNLTSINTSAGSSAASFIYLTDAGTNQIFSETAGSSTACSLSPISGSLQTNLPGTSFPVNSFTNSTGQFLYVLNQNSTSLNPTANPAQSTISAFTIDGNGRLSILSDSTNNPYAVGSGPVCVVQDPTHQYLYTSNFTDSTITGKLFDQRYGYLSNLARGSVFTTSMRPGCLAVSGNVD